MILKAADVDFSYDWLVHIGASTKRETPGTYAGFFGEGFKIASLCALRDHGWNVEMASRDWTLQVTKQNIVIDDRNVSSLAYRIWKVAVHSLRISAASELRLCYSFGYGHQATQG